MQNMMAKHTPTSASSCLKHQECGEDLSELRHKLSSVGWIQCDNPSCLKWRQVRLQVLQQVDEDTPWTCAMNEDDSYNRCSIPEEDTSSFERLAKKAKLDIITSSLKSGALVWAKVQGYCRWPALITADPLSGEHTDEDQFEPVQYHVEFLGGKRSHGWIRTKFVEVFGPGNIESVTAASQVQQGSAKKPKDRTSIPKVNLRHGGHRLRQAINEALQLLPLPLEARLQTCQFVTVSDVNTRSQADGKQQPANTNCKYHWRQSLAAAQHNIRLTTDTSGKAWKSSYRWQQINNNSSYTEHSTHLTTDNSSKALRCSGRQRAGNKNCAQTDNRTSPASEAVHSTLTSRQLQVISLNIGTCTLSAHASSQMKTPGFMEFPSSLICSSKEARFMEDVQRYQHNEQLFQQELALFNARHSLSPPDVPAWQNLQASKYSVFLEVLNRGGFLAVSENRQWSCVYTEVTNLSCRQGAGLCCKYYQRHLYPFELYICGCEHTSTDVQPNVSKSPVKEAGDSGVDTDDMQTGCDDEFDHPDIVRHLDELEQILTSLDQYGDRQGHIQDKRSEVLPLTGAPALVHKCHSSATSSPDPQVLHEVQALQHDLDFLQEEIDLL